jgi:CRP-like cAMP-binding protein
MTEGLAHLSIALPAGNASTIELYGAGDAVGGIGHLLGRPFPAGTSALMDSTAIYIPSAAVADFGKVNLNWLEAPARLLAARVERHFLLRTICAQSARRRVPSILLFLADLMGNDIHLTQANIA